MPTSVTEVAEQIPFEAPAAVRETLRTLGRTEDVRFSPSGRRLAIACYVTARVAVVDLELENGAIALTGIELVRSDALREPHGLDFADEDTLVVANRGSGLQVLALAGNGRGIAADSETSALLDSPGSVVVRPLDSGGHEVLACNNWTSTLARLALDGGSLAAGEIIGRKRLDLPDGLALSGDGEWLAVSNHNTHTVLLFAYRSLDVESEPAGVLRGVRYPHGLRFAADDRALLVADAGAPYVHVFAADGGWRGARYPSSLIRVMDDATFARGHRMPAEGGPKGIDVELRAGVLAITSEQQPLAFFDLGAALVAGRPAGYDDALAQYELHVLSQADAAKSEAETRVAAARALVADLHASRAWRLTAPARKLNAVLRSLRRRPRRGDG